jgi:flavin reductase (DIM6/NTAB) family NADH-FMN oxidoreductase RutF
MQYAVSDVNHHDRYKILTAFVLPRPIAWLTTIGSTGVVNAAPFSFFNVFAEDPPLVMVAINKRPDGRIKDSWLNIERTGEFVVNLTDEPLARAMHESSGDFPPDVGEPGYLGLKLAPSVDIKPPRLADSRRVVGPQGDAGAHGEVSPGRPHVCRPLLPHRRPHRLPGG